MEQQITGLEGLGGLEEEVAKKEEDGRRGQAEVECSVELVSKNKHRSGVQFDVRTVVSLWVLGHGGIL